MEAWMQRLIDDHVVTDAIATRLTDDPWFRKAVEIIGPPGEARWLTDAYDAA